MYSIVFIVFRKLPIFVWNFHFAHVLFLFVNSVWQAYSVLHTIRKQQQRIDEMMKLMWNKNSVQNVFVAVREKIFDCMFCTEFHMMEWFLYERKGDFFQ